MLPLNLVLIPTTAKQDRLSPRTTATDQILNVISRVAGTPILDLANQIVKPSFGDFSIVADAKSEPVTIAADNLSIRGMQTINVNTTNSCLICNGTLIGPQPLPASSGTLFASGMQRTNGFNSTTSPTLIFGEPLTVNSSGWWTPAKKNLSITGLQANNAFTVNGLLSTPTSYQPLIPDYNATAMGALLLAPLAVHSQITVHGTTMTGSLSIDSRVPPSSEKPRGAHFCAFTTPRPGNTTPSAHDELVSYLKSEFVKGIENFWTGELAEGNIDCESQRSFMKIFPNFSNKQMGIYQSMISKFQLDFIKARNENFPDKIFALNTKKHLKIAIQDGTFDALFDYFSNLSIPERSWKCKIDGVLKDRNGLKDLQRELVDQADPFNAKLDDRLETGVQGTRTDLIEKCAKQVEFCFQQRWNPVRNYLLGKYSKFRDEKIEIFVTELVTVLGIIPENYTNLRRIRINELTSKVESCFLNQLEQYKIHLSRRLQLTFECQYNFIQKLLVIHHDYPKEIDGITIYVIQKIEHQYKLDGAADSSSKKPLYRVMQGKHVKNSVDAVECAKVANMVKPLWKLLFVNNDYVELQDAHTVLFPGVYSWEKQPSNSLTNRVVKVAHDCLFDASETHHMFGIFNAVDGKIEAKLSKKAKSEEQYKPLLGAGLIAGYKEGLKSGNISLERVLFHNQSYLKKVRDKANNAIESTVDESSNSDQTLIDHIFKATAPILLDAVDRLQNNIPQPMSI